MKLKAYIKLKKEESPLQDYERPHSGSSYIHNDPIVKAISNALSTIIVKNRDVKHDNPMLCQDDQILPLP